MATLDTVSPQELALNAQKERRDMRLEMVRRLLIRGIKNPLEIQRSLASLEPPIHVTTRTIFRYKAAIENRTIKAIQKKEGLGKTIEEMAMGIKETFEEVTREMWKQYHAPIKLYGRCPHYNHTGKDSCGLTAEFIVNAATIKVAALKEIRDTAFKNLEVMQSLGLVNKAPEKHQMVDRDGNPIDPVSENTMVLNQQFTAFVNSLYKDPVGINKGDSPEKQADERN